MLDLSFIWPVSKKDFQTTKIYCNVEIKTRWFETYNSHNLSVLPHIAFAPNIHQFSNGHLHPAISFYIQKEPEVLNIKTSSIYLQAKTSSTISVVDENTVLKNAFSDD